MLFDHCVPKPLRHELKEHEVSTAKEMGWEGLRNGQLLEQAQANGFDVVITVDQNIRFQQNLKGRAIAVCVLVAGGVTVEDLRLGSESRTTAANIKARTTVRSQAMTSKPGL